MGPELHCRNFPANPFPMKLFLNTSFALLTISCWTLAEAQISIGSADLPQPGIVYNVVNTTAINGELTNISGANVTWDASNLVSLGDAPVAPIDINEASITAALVFNSPFNSTYQCDYYLPTVFPDLGVDLPIPIEGFNNFYQTDGSHYSIAGIGLSASGFDLPVAYDDIDEFFPIPFNFDQSFESSAAFELNLEGILSYSLDQTRSVTADGWGTLILPGGTFDALRTRTQLNATDDIFIEQFGEPFTIERDQVIYQWWGEGTGVPLLEITEIMGVPALATMQDIQNSSGMAISANSGISAFPNPIRVGQVLTIGSTPVEYVLYDMLGQRIHSGFSIDVSISSDWNAGVYSIETDGVLQRIIVQ